MAGEDARPPRLGIATLLEATPPLILRCSGAFQQPSLEGRTTQDP